ncbi:MAG: hypothetical protein KGR24_05975 [Planctomycetes bacterium]|nr:hypothetical protein [Planctomycetota bacterium]
MSIATHPLAAAGQAVDVVDKIAAYLNTARLAAVDGLTWQEFGELLLGLLRVAVTTLDAVGNLSGEDKKEIVMHAVARLFDMVANQAVPTSVYPLWILVRSPVRSLVLALASGAVEQLLPLVRLA